MTAALATIPQFLCVGVNHHHTPVSIRERVAIPDGLLPNALNFIRQEKAVQEAAIISTCNRLEVYAIANSNSPLALEQFLHRFHGLTDNVLTDYLYRYTGQDAAKQLFRVATALDALVVGEPQVLGQVKHAYTQAQHHGTLGPALHGLFNKAIYTAKRVRTETALSTHAVTISYAAVELARKVFGDLKGLTCLIVGAGEMSELAASYLHQRGVQLLFANRSLENAERLAKQFEGQAIDIRSLDILLQKADITLTSTAAGHVLLHRAHIKKSIRARRYKPMLFIDISVPRNVDKTASNLDGVYVYDIDDLKHVVQDNLAHRHQAVQHAETIITEELGALFDQLHARQADPLIKQLKLHSNHIVELEVAKLFSSLQTSFSPEEQALIHNMGHAIANKLLHIPITQIKAAAQNGERDRLAMLQQLFALQK